MQCLSERVYISHPKESDTLFSKSLRLVLISKTRTCISYIRMNTDDKQRNILASLMNRQAYQQGEPPQKETTNSSIGQLMGRPTSVLSNTSMASNSKQHKLSKRFTVIRKLGKGTYGKVQLAINKETGQEVAIKTIKKSKIDSEEDMQRVRREIGIMRSIEHPHIIHIYEEFENKDKIVLIMQYAPGGELYEHVSQSKLLDDGEARRLFRQIATAIYYCHQNKICHRDLKLENILLDEKNNAKLADFGLSNVFDKENQLKTFCGSPLYASPEIVQGSPYKGPEVDCWSLGVLLYTLVYGAMPFDGSNFKRLVKQISEASYYEPSEKKSPASPLIRQLLCADPRRRATIIDICSDSWVNGGSPMSADKTTATATPQHPSLLKVAQDMANLTPVRIDMLQALTMGEQAAQQQREAETSARRLLAPIVNVTTDSNNVPAELAKRVSPLQILDPSTVMEVDESRATSPIASYIVRDLEPHQSLPPAPPTAASELEPARELAEADTAEISVEQEAIVALEDDQLGGGGATTRTIEIVPNQQAMIDSDQMHTGTGQHAPQEELKASEESQQQLDEAGDAKESRKDTNEHAEPDKEVKMETEQPETTECDSGEPEVDNLTDQAHGELEGKQERAEEVEMKLGKQQVAVVGDDMSPTNEADNRKDDAESNKELASPEKMIPIETDGGGGGGGDDEAQAKPKKAKKKIIVVRKKKRISKKEAAPNEAPGEQHELSAKQTNDKSNHDEKEMATSSKQISSAEQIGETSKQTKPGKVKIPNTFQATEVEQQQQQSGNHQTGRRQSALIADVSQKLLQSVLAEQKPVAPTIIESDQLQLKNVRVSDKKDELERRASLAQQQAAEQLLMAAAASQRSQSISPAAGGTAEQQVEALQAELVRDLQSLSAIETDTVESNSIQKLEPHSNEPASLIVAPDRSNQQLLLQTPSGDERSDSLETIKAADQAAGQEEDKPTNNCVRSSLQIDLSPLQDICQEVWRQQDDNQAAQSATSERREQTATAAGGPAPIARSYKKVTFTKDGACITETGKIYSTQANDGSLRRVERKSKVTHYPAQQSGDDNDNSKSSRSKIHKEEVVYCENAGGSRRHLERLIMPSQISGDSDSDNNGDDFMFNARSSSLFSPTRQQREVEQQRDRTGSSCSSGSTDALEDIFDTWTGAISMFNRPNSRLFERAASRLSSAGSFGRPKRQHRASGSHAGTPRCESVEPQMDGARQQESRQQTQHQQRLQSSTTSGYESDAAGGSHQKRSHQRRPTKPASARGLFGSWNLLNELDDRDDLFGDISGRQRQRHKQRDVFVGGFDRDPFEILEMEQKSLRERLAQQHKQLWKGSSPSLFDDFSFGKESTATSRKPPVVKDPRLPSGSGGGHRSTSGGQVDQSHSSSSFKVQQQSSRQTATPLEAAPIRRNTTNFSPIVRKSTSTSQTATTASKTESVADQATTFIELKRTSSSLGSSALSRSVLRSSSSKLTIQLQQQQQQQRQQQQLETSTNDDSTSSSSFWNNRETPPMAGTSSFDTHSTVAGETVPVTSTTGACSESPARESVDRRIQSWLQESSGNLSATSSGSKSSQSASISDSLHSGQRRAHDPFENLYGSLWQTSKSISSSRTKMIDHLAGLPPAAASSPGPTRSILSQQADKQQQQQQQQQQQLLRHSTSGSVVVSKQQQSIIESADCSNQETAKRMMTMMIEKSQESSVRCKESDDAARFATASRTSSIIMNQTRTASPLVGNDNETSSGMPKTTTSNDSNRWMQQSSSSRILSCAGGDDLDFDSLSGGDLESRSSSSLLDQLKAKGYRSMINKRMVDVSGSTVAAKSSSASKVFDDTSGATKTTIVQESYSHSSRISKRSQHDDDDDDENEPLRVIEGAAEAQQQKQIQADGTVLSCSSIICQPEGVEDAQNNNIIGRVSEEQPDAVNEEDDEDVKEAKASIKCHLDRVKETELFLKSLKKDEEIYERKRQQMILFNDLVLGARFNCFKPKFVQENSLLMATADSTGADLTLGSADSSHYRINTGLRSAPVQNYRCDSSKQENGFLSNGPNLSSSAALSFEPTYVFPGGHQQRASTTMANGPTWMESNPIATDPLLEPVKPIYYTQQVDSSSNYGCSTAPLDDYSLQPVDRFRRSRSQLGDQFSNYKQRNVHPSSLETTFAANPIVAPTSSEIYYPSRAKRSLSQLRYSSNRLSQPVAMSEYRSAYQFSNNNRGMVGPGIQASVRSQVSDQHGEKDTDDDEDGMSAYRASSYVPKIVPSMTMSRGRSREKRRSYMAPSNEAAIDDDRPSVRQRRISLQVNCSNRNSSPGAAITEEKVRRRSLASTTNGEQENSRLSELEQRITENKRRREELLSGKLSPDTTDDSSTKESTTMRMRRVSSPAASPARNSASLLGRPSRLESMEARIKRKSYCVRVGDCSPERAQSLRGQMSLEKWRQSSSSSATMLQTNRPDSLAMDASSLLLSGVTGAKRRSSITKTTMNDYDQNEQGD